MLHEISQGHSGRGRNPHTVASSQGQDPQETGSPVTTAPHPHSPWPPSPPHLNRLRHRDSLDRAWRVEGQSRWRIDPGLAFRARHARAALPSISGPGRAGPEPRPRTRLLVPIFPSGPAPPARLIEANLRGQGLSLPPNPAPGSSPAPNYGRLPHRARSELISSSGQFLPGGREMLSRPDRVSEKAFCGLRFARRRWRA